MAQITTPHGTVTPLRSRDYTNSQLALIQRTVAADCNKPEMGVVYTIYADQVQGALREFGVGILHHKSGLDDIEGLNVMGNIHQLYARAALQQGAFKRTGVIIPGSEISGEGNQLHSV